MNHRITIVVVLVLIYLNGCSQESVKSKERKREAARQQLIKSTLKDYPKAKAFPPDELEHGLTIERQDFLIANPGPYYIVAEGSQSLWGFDIERRKNGIFLSCDSDSFERLLLRCSQEQVDQILENKNEVFSHLIVFTLSNMQRADFSILTYADYGYEFEELYVTTDIEDSTLLIAWGELVEIFSINED